MAFLVFGPVPTFAFTVDTTITGVSASNQFKLPLYSGGAYNFSIAWGDGTSNAITSYNQAEITHTYAAGGQYTCRMTGAIKGWQFLDNEAHKMLDISSWGPLQINNTFAFTECVNLNISASDNLDLSQSGDLTQWLKDTAALSGGASLGNWDVTPVSSFSGLFFHSVFNQDISRWNMSHATSMGEMFRGANKFNKDISGWDVSHVTNFSFCFIAQPGDNLFNQPIGAWNTGSATTMSNMFRDATAFDQDISNWNVANVTDLSGMFSNQSGFPVCGLSTAHYDALLIAWASQSVQSNVTFDAGGRSTYTAAGTAAAARASLISNHGWTITDGGSV